MSSLQRIRGWPPCCDISPTWPMVGDAVYLHDGDKLVAGPWIVVAWTTASRVGHPADSAAVQREIDTVSYGMSALHFVWLQLRASPDLRAGAYRDELPTSSRMWAHPLDAASEVEQHLTQSAHDLSQQYATRRS
jgi:hypothetical protein